MFLTNNAPVLIPLLYLVTAMLIPVIAIKKKSLAFPVTFAASLGAFCLSVFNIFQVMEKGAIHYRLGDWAPPVGIEYVLDHLSGFIMLVINVVAFLIMMYAPKVVRRELPGKEVPYYTAMVLMLCGFNGIVITGDLFNLYVFLEISSLSLYGLIASGEKQAPVAAFRYLIMGTIAGSFYLLGVGFLYMVTGSLNMADVKALLLQPALANHPTVMIAVCMMVLGAAIKMALFPVHGWLPDAYTYAPTTSSALIAPTGTKVAAYILIRLMIFVFGVKYITETLPIGNIIAWLAAFGIIYGSVMAIAQKELKRMLAYSSVAQVGYIGLGIGLANPMALTGAILHIINHAFMKGALFLVAGNFRYKLGHSNIFKLDNTVRKKMPWTMLAFTIAALSMIGLPPMAGFFSKWYLVLGTLKDSNWVFLGVIVLSSLLNAVYFFRVLEKVYMKPIVKGGTHDAHDDHGLSEPVEPHIKREEVSSSMLIPTLIMSVGLIVLGLLNAFIVKGIIKFIIPAGM